MSLLFPPVLIAPQRFNPSASVQVPPIPLALASVPLLFGANTNTQPVNEPQEARTGNVQPLYGFADWYERVHIFPGAIDLGNLVSEQTRNVTIWNAHTTGKTLQQIEGTNTEGITLNQPAAAPLFFEPLRERVYTVEIDTKGPPQIDASYVFEFNGTNSPALTITGTRIIAWTWFPNWADPMVERLQWLTDVMVSYDGTEQRAKLREYPRRSFEFSFSADGTQRRRLDSLLYGWGGRVWALPVWTDGERLAAALPGGSLSIPVTTTGRDYHPGGLAMLLTEAGDYEVVEVETISAGAINLVRPTLRDWAAGECAVYPARPARMPANHGFKRFTHDFAYGRVVMELDDTSEVTPAEFSAVTYRGRPVLTEKPNWIEDISVEFRRKLAALDFNTGRRAFLDESGVPEIAQNYRWTMTTRERAAQLRAWFYARGGKASDFWLPTWVDDLIVAENIGASATAIDVQNIGYSAQAAARLHRRDIRIELTSGQVFYRRITGASEVSATVERLSIDSALGVSATTAQIVQVSYMMVARLDTDGIDLAWFSGDVCEAAHPVKGVGNGI